MRGKVHHLVKSLTNARKGTTAKGGCRNKGLLTVFLRPLIGDLQSGSADI